MNIVNNYPIKIPIPKLHTQLVPFNFILQFSLSLLMRQLQSRSFNASTLACSSASQPGCTLGGWHRPQLRAQRAQMAACGKFSSCWRKCQMSASERYDLCDKDRNEANVQTELLL
jgi:hypothetical protein